MPNEQSQTCLQHPATDLEINSPLTPQKDPDLQHQRVLLYGAETWRVTKPNTHKLQTFTNRSLRNILGIRWPELVSNKQLWDRTRQAPIETETQKRKWGWIGHTLRKPATTVTRKALIIEIIRIWTKRA